MTGTTLMRARYTAYARRCRKGPQPGTSPHDTVTALRHDMTERARALEAQLQVALTKRDCERTLPMRGDPAACGPDWSLREGTTERLAPTKSTASVERAS